MNKWKKRYKNSNASYKMLAMQYRMKSAALDDTTKEYQAQKVELYYAKQLIDAQHQTCAQYLTDIEEKHKTLEQQQLLIKRLYATIAESDNHQASIINTLNRDKRDLERRLDARPS